MKNKLTVLLFALVLVITLFALASCGETADTTAGESTTTSDGIVTTAPMTTEAPNQETPMTGDDALAAFLYADDKMGAIMSVTKGFDAIVAEEYTYDGVTDRTEMAMKIAYVDGETTLFVSMDMEGTLVEMTYIDGIVYTKMTMPGFVMKVKSTDTSAVESFEKIGNNFSSVDEEDDNDMVSAEFISRDGGLYVIKAKISDEAAYQKVKENLEEDEIDTADLHDVSGYVTYECDVNGLVSKMINEFTYTLDGEVYQEATSVTFSNIGEVPTIIAPEDADEYVDMDNM